MDRGKRLSRSNVIGKQGEFVFAQWALAHQLSPNKADTDIGVDYFCQLMGFVKGSQSMEGAGPILGAQVKTVENEAKPRLRLDRIDATDLLRQTQATCLFGLRLSDNNVRFQFFTKDLIDRLLEFLETDADQMTIPYSEMSDDGKLFDKLLRKYTNPFEQLQLRIHLIRRRVGKAISGATLSVESSDEQTVCRVYVPWASAAFTVDLPAREEVRLNVLREGTIDLDAAGVNVHPAILEALAQTQSSRLILTGRSAERVRLSIRLGAMRAVEQFERHVHGTEIAYVHRAGLRLTHNTRPEKTSEGYVHRLESEVFRPGAAAPLTGNVLVFLRLFKPGAVLTLPSDWDLPLSSFGESLEEIGAAIEPIPDLCRSLSLPLGSIALHDITDEEFARSTRFLEAVLLKGYTLEQFASGLIVGPASDLPVAGIPTTRISISIPTVLNWKDRGIVIWVECDADGFLHQGLLCGIRIYQQRSWRIGITDRFQKSVYPELWVAKDWPAIPIGSGASGKQTWTYDPTRAHPLEAVIEKRSAKE